MKKPDFRQRSSSWNRNSRKTTYDPDSKYDDISYHKLSRRESREVPRGVDRSDPEDFRDVSKRHVKMKGDRNG